MRQATLLAALSAILVMGCVPRVPVRVFKPRIPAPKINAPRVNPPRFNTPSFKPMEVPKLKMPKTPSPNYGTGAKLTAPEMFTPPRAGTDSGFLNRGNQFGSARSQPTKPGTARNGKRSDKDRDGGFDLGGADIPGFGNDDEDDRRRPGMNGYRSGTSPRGFIPTRPNFPTVPTIPNQRGFNPSRPSFPAPVNPPRPRIPTPGFPGRPR